MPSYSVDKDGKKTLRHATQPPNGTYSAQRETIADKPKPDAASSTTPVSTPANSSAATRQSDKESDDASS